MPSDNITLNPGSGGVSLGADVVGDTFYERVKLALGADGVFDGDVHGANPLPAGISLADSVFADAVGRARTRPRLLFAQDFRYNANPLQWENGLSGAATTTHLPNEGTVRLNVTAAAADDNTLVTRQYWPLTPGRANRFDVVFVLATAAAGITEEVGIGDADNAFVLRRVGTGSPSFTIRSKVTGSVVTTAVSQADWDDPMDGSTDSASGVVIDLSKAQTLFVEVSRAGRVRMGFVIGGRSIIAHTFSYENNLSTVAVTSLGLPVRFFLDTDGSSASSMRCVAATVTTECGDGLPSPQSFGASHGAKALSAGANPGLSIRPKATLNSVTVRGLLELLDVWVFTDMTTIRVDLIYGGALTGAAWGSVDAESMFEVDSTATVLTGGVRVGVLGLMGGGITPSRSLFDGLSIPPVALDASGAHPTAPYSDILTISLARLGGATNGYSGMTWREQR